LTARLIRALWVAIGVTVIALSVFPWARWTMAPDIGPPWTLNVSAWGWGTLTVALSALMIGWLAARFTGSLPRLPALRDGVVVATLAALLAVAAAVVMRAVFSANPELVDEMAQLFHARVFASGHLAAPPPHPEAAFLILQTWVTKAGWVSQYPPGETALLAVGLRAHAEWLVNPLLGGVDAVLVFVTARGLYGRRTALAATVLWTLSAWVLFMSASYTSHVGAVTFALVAWAFVLRRGRIRPVRYVLAGLALGLCTVTRPLDGIAAMAPVGVWLIATGRWRRLGWVVSGGAPMAVAWGLINWRLYGSPLATGYGALYGSMHHLGFHTDPWGRPFTPLVALGNVAVAVRRLSIYLYEWPIPALLPLVVWALLGGQRRSRDLVLLTGIVAAPVLYFFYWDSGFYRGPRFYYAAAPMLVIGTARAWRWAWVAARRRRGKRMRRDVVVATVAVAVLAWGAVGVLPGRIAAYRRQFPTLRLHPERELASRGVQRALVLVKQSFSSRVMVRLWALGVNPGLVERVYRRLDTCDLSELAAWGEAGAPLAAVRDSIVRLERAAAPVPTVPNWPDPTLRLRPGRRLPERCRQELNRDLRGFTLYPQLAWRNAVGLHHGIVFAQDLFEEDDRLLAEYPGWPVWRYAPPVNHPTALPVLTPDTLGAAR
jgi:hypothetical protein